MRAIRAWDRLQAGSYDSVSEFSKPDAIRRLPDHRGGKS